MRRFSQHFACAGLVKHLAVIETVGSSGSVSHAYPDPADPPSGEVVSASVQFGEPSRKVDGDGRVSYETGALVILLDNPRLLNGGLGPRRDDAFWWDLDGRLLVAQGDPVRVGSAWQVPCLASQ